jgi:dienelactone hydrolase
VELGADVQAVRGHPSRVARLSRFTARAIDRGLLSALTSPARIPSLEACLRVRGEAERARELYLGEGHLHALPSAPPRPNLVRRRHVGPYEQLSFPSAYGLSDRDLAGERWRAFPGNDHAHAWVLRHERGADRPWLFCLHGLLTGRPLMDFPAFRVGQLHRELGLNLVMPVLPLHGPRRHRDVSISALASFELVDTFHGLRQAVWDVRCMIAWARSQGATRIGLYGMSVGAYVSALVASLEELEVLIAGIPLVDIPDLIEHHVPLDDARRQALLSPAVRELFGAISPLVLEPRVPVERRAIYAGSDDLVTTAHQAERLRRHWKRPSVHWFPGAHVSFFWAPTVAPYVAERLRAADFVAKRR